MRKTGCILLVTGATLSACAPSPPALPHLTIGEYSGRCGYSWNDGAIDLEMLPRLADDWTGSKDVLMVFRFDSASEGCVERGRQAYRDLGFRRIYVISMDDPEIGDPPLIAPRGGGLF